jgi:lipid A ethanolaminephosphotransferase
VPFLLWTSQGFAERMQLDSACLRARAQRPASHDNLYHTLLGAAGMRNAVYKPDLDVLAGCRAQARSPGVE